MEGLPSGAAPSTSEGVESDTLVQKVKDYQRQTELARHAWNSFCETQGGGVRDPRKHSAEFLQSFLAAYEEGSLSAAAEDAAAAGDGRGGATGGGGELAEVVSREPALGERQLRLRMPASEEGIMKEVVSTNVYGFLPGHSCVLHDGDVVLDIGAHVGIAATLALRTKDVRVVCVEPHPVTFDILRRNMAAHGDGVTLVNKGVADSTSARPLYVHSGTNAPSRLYFSSLFDTRRHADETVSVECIPLQELLDSYDPTVIKIDAEGAERFLVTVTDFRHVLLIVVEWDWTHNRNRSEWQRAEAHLQDSGFQVDVKGRMPAFDESGNADLCDKNGKKRGNTGMIFVAMRKAEPPSCKRRRPTGTMLAGAAEADGCPVGALVCDKSKLRRVFDACRPSGLAQQKGAMPYEGRMAVHLNLEAAALMCSGQVPPEVQELIDQGVAEFIAGLRKGTQSQAYRGSAAPLSRGSSGASPSTSFRFIDLFAGIGGFRRGLETVGGSCVFTSEIDVDCQETYALNFGGEHLFGDLTAIDTPDFPEHDILTAGFPCQPFSRRGERGGFDDGRGGLFLEITRVLRACRPAGFLLENVWNLQYVDGGQWDKDESKSVYGDIFNFIIESLRQCGYVVKTKMLNAQGWVPQDRKRVYLVGFREDLAAGAGGCFEWPEPPGGGVIGDVLEPACSSDSQTCQLTESQWAAVQKSSTWQSGGAGFRFADRDGVATTLTASYKSSFANVAQLVGPAEGTLDRPRFFTPRECARIMGFCEEHVVGNPNSRNRAYHQLGNAVCPPLIEAIARNLVRSLGLVPDGEETVADEGTAEYLTVTGAQPELAAQLEALTVEQLSARLEAFGVSVRQPGPEEFVQGFKALRKAELNDALCAAYAAGQTSQPRNVVHDVGVALSESATGELLAALRMMDWKENVRPNVHASGYVVLKRPYELSAPPRWRAEDPRAVRRRVWELSEALLRAASPKAAGFAFTAMAVSKNFRGSPHVDKNDISVQYALSLGEFAEGGGKLCVEESASVVRAFDTRGRLVCIDGRFPHWVSGYVGERYSVIFYRSSGEEDPSTCAVHEV